MPTEGEIAREALRTIPPRETAGNIDIKQISPGTTVLLPVYVAGGPGFDGRRALRPR